jgi:hypothetical protein
MVWTRPGSSGVVLRTHFKLLFELVVSLVKLVAHAFTNWNQIVSWIQGLRPFAPRHNGNANNVEGDSNPLGVTKD